ncbi:MAG: lysophospholipid acyltransferase family protein [Candidatus Margulisiibacteriota bacterium]
MVVLKFLLSLFFWSYVQLGVLIVALISLPAYLLPRHGRAFNYLLTRLLLKVLFFLCFFRVKITGLENLPQEGRLIFIANKPDLISTFALIAYFPRRIRFAAEEAIFKKWFLGRLIAAIGCIAVVKDKQASFQFAAAVLTSLKEAEAVLFYPANLRRWDGRITAFMDAELKVAQLCQASLVPIVVKGTDKVIPKGSMILSPGRIQVMIKKPLGHEELADIGLVSQKLDALYKEE